jgi:O-antigen/teichoic acid export membrane protein
MTPALALAGTGAVRQFFYARHDVGRLATIDLSTSVVSAVAIVGLALGGAGPVVLAAVASAVSVVNSLLILHAAGRWLRPDGRSAERPPSLVRLLKDSAPIGIASFLATAYVSIDVVILSNLFPAGLVGQYAGAVKVLSILTIFPGLVMSVALPQLSADWSDRLRTGVMITRLWHWFVSLVLPGLVIVFANAGGVMTLLFGDAYLDAGRYLRILMLAGAVSMFSQLLGVIVVAAARARWLVAQNVIALVVNVGGNLLLAPRFGIATAAWLTVGTEVIVCGGSWLVLRDRIPHRALLGVSLAPFATAVVAVLAGRLLAPAPMVSPAVAAVVYIGGLTLLRAWPVELVRMIPGRARS